MGVETVNFRMLIIGHSLLNCDLRGGDRDIMLSDRQDASRSQTYLRRVVD